MSFSVVRVNVTSSQTLLIALNYDRSSLIIRNTGSKTVFLGNNSSVTSTNGFPLLPNDIFKDTVYNNQWNIVCAAGDTSTVEVIQEDWD